MSCQISSLIFLAYDLNVTDIRLTNGTGKYDGLVEIKMDDTWGTICSRYFDEEDGSILCKMLNLR